MAVKPEHMDWMAKEAVKILDRYFPPPIRTAVRPFVRIPSLAAILSGIPSELQQYKISEVIEALETLAQQGKIPRQL